MSRAVASEAPLIGGPYQGTRAPSGSPRRASSSRSRPPRHRSSSTDGSSRAPARAARSTKSPPSVVTSAASATCAAKAPGAVTAVSATSSVQARWAIWWATLHPAAGVARPHPPAPSPPTSRSNSSLSARRSSSTGWSTAHSLASRHGNARRLSQPPPQKASTLACFRDGGPLWGASGRRDPAMVAERALCAGGRSLCCGSPASSPERCADGTTRPVPAGAVGGRAPGVTGRGGGAGPRRAGPAPSAQPRLRTRCPRIRRSRGGRGCRGRRSGPRGGPGGPCASAPGCGPTSRPCGRR
ncbi:hypothetical protein BG846_02026 [Streptomyces fradiae ATCC 10745 = DSM 40063]|uniref:Uncharacterized protein n=1 Tax=Streptomyces fradiae ATCC 10745 = DSM 40063 TaxID=1319510 RepID=A0A1Y2NZ35_STRFR|nr:hypothetical protein BG846_02026 [Streptomyces fradiae ATCC 10745 = DSM 40063]